MKNTKHSKRSESSRLFGLIVSMILFLGILLVNAGANAQTATQVIASSSGVPGGAYSPSIASFVSSTSQKTIVTAYTYNTGTGSSYNRKVGISRSTDAGTTWAVVPSSTGPGTIFWTMSGSSGSGALANVDDAQVVSMGGNNLVLVVRAWSASSSTIFGNNGNNYKGQPGTIFTQSGIYLCVSTDAGRTWGYYTNSNSTPPAFVQGTWCKIDQNDDYSNLDNTLHEYRTFEYPRIACRPEFDTKGYIVWERRNYIATNNLMKFGYEIGTGIAGLHPDDIGICCFNATSTSSPIGTPYLNYNSRVQGNPAIPEYATAFLTSSIHGSGAPYNWNGLQRPSVAIAPDGRLWLGLYECAYYLSDQDPDDEDYVWSGDHNLPTQFLIASGTCGIQYYGSSGAGTPLYANFGAFDASVVASKPLAGMYSIERGYTYLRDLNTQYESGLDGGGIAIINNFTQNADFDIDAAAGPSVQVVCDQPLSCNPTYHVGFLYLYGSPSPYSLVDGINVNGWGTTDGTQYTTPVTHLGFLTRIESKTFDFFQF